jgi:hypothetical protein
MKRQKIEIGHSLAVRIQWYDRVPEPPKTVEYEGEIIGWRDTQIIVRVKEYAVVRFWKKSGLEVGNPDHQRRGLSIDLKELAESLKPAPGVTVEIARDGQLDPGPSKDATFGG